MHGTVHAVGGVWRSWGGVLLASAAGLPVAGLVAWVLAVTRPQRPVRYAVAEVAIVAGTVPWLWMILTPSPGTPRRLSLVPLRDLIQLAPADVVVQVGGNLLVFAALGFFLPIRFAARVPAVLACATAGSMTVETLQYVLDLGRVSSVDDVLVNAAGAGLAALGSVHWWRLRRGAGPARRAARVPAQQTSRGGRPAASARRSR